MKNIKLNTKKLVVILVSGFILITSVGCSNKNSEEINSSYYQEYNQVESNDANTEKQTEKLDNSNHTKEEIPSEKVTSTENKIVENSNNSYTSDDIEVINYFNEIESSVEVELQNETDESIKDKLKGTFITIVDFLFYDSEINGIKFEDLTEGAKQNILETVSSIDNKIMSKYPNYKEEISTATKSAYNKASEIIKKGANNVKEFSKEKLGEENYNAIIDAKDELVYYTKKAVNIIGNVVGSIWETGKSKIKTWYENFRN